MQWPNVKVTVRSSHDPLLYAQVLTNGSYDFGSRSKTLILTGGVLALTMIMLMIRPLVVVCKAYRRSGGCKEICRAPAQLGERNHHYRIDEDQGDLEI